MKIGLLKQSGKIVLLPEITENTMNNSKKYFVLALSLLPLVGFSQTKLTDTTKLNEVVVSENRLQIPFNKAARNIQIVTREEISAMPVKSLNEVLSFVGGVDLRQRGVFGTQADVSIDGGSFEQTLILLNGMKISDAQTAHHSLNIPIPLSAIERIELIKGPAARIYGINALTGAINIITKTQENSSIEVASQWGSSFAQKATGDGTGIYSGGNAQATINIAAKNNQHLFALGLDDYNGQRYNSATKDQKYFYQGKIDLDAKNQVNLMGGYINNSFGASGYYASPIDKEAYEIVRTALAGISSSHQLSTNFILKPRFSSRYNWDDYRFYRNNLSVARSEHRTAVWSGELNSNLHTSIGDFGFGIESRSENIHSTNIGHRQRYNHGFYTEYKTEAVKDLLLNIGAYLNYNTQYGWQGFPGLDAAYLLDNHWKLAFNVGSSQRIPSFTDLYLNQAPANIGNANLKSENAWQSELSIQYKLDNFQWQGGYFYRNIDAFIDWVRPNNTTPYQPQNFGSNNTQGLYTAVKQQFGIGKNSNLGYELNYHYLNAGKLTYTSGLTSKYVAEYLKNQFLAQLNFRSTNWQINIDNRWTERVLKKSYFITDFRVQRNQKQWSIYLDGTNIFGTKYIETAAVPLPSRWYALGINYRIGL